jgi:hypothetical protein
MERAEQATMRTDLPRAYWIHLLGAIIVAAGFADYPLIAYHFARAVTGTVIPLSGESNWPIQASFGKKRQPAD